MRPIRLVLVLVLFAAAAIPVLGATGADITIPVMGYLELPNRHVYRSELMVTNHRDVDQNVRLDFLDGRPDEDYRTVFVRANTTLFIKDGRMPNFLQNRGDGNGVGAMRLRGFSGNYDGTGPFPYDAGAQLEARAFIVSERGRFAVDGSSRQVIEAIPSSEYLEREMVFAGVRQEQPTYTNVAIANLSDQTQTFIVQYQELASLNVVVPPRTTRQVRIPGQGNGYRSVSIYPEWALLDPAFIQLEWVAQASTVDGVSGEAFSGLRVPKGTVLQ